MALRATTAALQVQVSESASVGDLKSYLEASECVVHVVDTHTLEVWIPRAPFEAQALRVLTLHLSSCLGGKHGTGLRTTPTYECYDRTTSRLGNGSGICH